MQGTGFTSAFARSASDLWSSGNQLVIDLCLVLGSRTYWCRKGDVSLQYPHGTESQIPSQTP